MQEHYKYNKHVLDSILTNFPRTGTQLSGCLATSLPRLVKPERSFSIIRYMFCGEKRGTKHTSF